MSSITSYATAQGLRYRVRYRKPDGRKTDKRGFNTQRAAEPFTARVETIKADGLYIDPTFGRKAVSAVRHIDVQEWISGQSGSPASIVKNHRVLSQILELAVEDGRLPSIPASAGSLPQVRPAKRRYLTPEQVEALARESWTGVWLFRCARTVRCGGAEMAALKVEDVDMLGRNIHITKSVTVVDCPRWPGRHRIRPA